MQGEGEAWTALRRLGRLPPSGLDLGEAALLLGAVRRPTAPLGRYRRHLTELIDEVASVAARPGVLESAAGRADALARVLVGRHGYAGDVDTYDDPANANLLSVIDRRRGLPVTLAILWLACGQAQGWDLSGINFPGHFLICLQHDGRRLILDPFHGGIARRADELRQLLKAAAGPEAELTPDHWAPLPAKGVLLRLETNIKVRALKAGDLPAAVESVELCLALAPEEPLLWREAGLLRARLGNLAAAIEALETYLAHPSAGADRRQAQQLLGELRRTLN